MVHGRHTRACAVRGGQSGMVQHQHGGNLPAAGCRASAAIHGPEQGERAFVVVQLAPESGQPSDQRGPVPPVRLGGQRARKGPRSAVEGVGGNRSGRRRIVAVGIPTAAHEESVAGIRFLFRFPVRPDHQYGRPDLSVHRRDSALAFAGPAGRRQADRGNRKAQHPARPQDPQRAGP